MSIFFKKPDLIKNKNLNLYGYPFFKKNSVHVGARCPKKDILFFLSSMAEEKGLLEQYRDAVVFLAEQEKIQRRKEEESEIVRRGVPCALQVRHPAAGEEEKESPTHTLVFINRVPKQLLPEQHAVQLTTLFAKDNGVCPIHSAYSNVTPEQATALVKAGGVVNVTLSTWIVENNTPGDDLEGRMHGDFGDFASFKAWVTRIHEFIVDRTRIARAGLRLITGDADVHGRPPQIQDMFNMLWMRNVTLTVGHATTFDGSSANQTVWDHAVLHDRFFRVGVELLAFLTRDADTQDVVEVVGLMSLVEQLARNDLCVEGQHCLEGLIKEIGQVYLNPNSLNPGLYGEELTVMSFVKFVDDWADITAVGALRTLICTLSSWIVGRSDEAVAKEVEKKLARYSRMKWMEATQQFERAPFSVKTVEGCRFMWQYVGFLLVSLARLLNFESKQDMFPPENFDAVVQQFESRLDKLWKQRYATIQRTAKCAIRIYGGYSDEDKDIIILCTGVRSMFKALLAISEWHNILFEYTNNRFMPNEMGTSGDNLDIVRAVSFQCVECTPPDVPDGWKWIGINTDNVSQPALEAAYVAAFKLVDDMKEDDESEYQKDRDLDLVSYLNNQESRHKRSRLFDRHHAELLVKISRIFSWDAMV